MKYGRAGAATKQRARGTDARSTDGRRFSRTNDGLESSTSSAERLRADAILNSTECKTDPKKL